MPDHPGGSSGSSTSSGGGTGTNNSSITTSTTVNVPTVQNGKVAVSSTQAPAGTTVTITVTPDDGCQVDSVTVTDKDGDPVEVTERNDRYTFVQPRVSLLPVTVDATFVRTDHDGQNNKPATFADVPNTYWAKNAIAWADTNGYMHGYSTTEFRPDGTVTRQQFWMILAHLSGADPADMDTPAPPSMPPPMRRMAG